MHARLLLAFGMLALAGALQGTPCGAVRSVLGRAVFSRYFPASGRVRASATLGDGDAPPQRTRSRSAAQVSDHGRFRSTRGVIRGGALIGGGHRFVKLDGKKYSLHSLVCAAWHGGPPTPEHSQVVHKDGDPSNNMPTNLEYATPGQVNRHSFVPTDRMTSAGDRFKPVRGRKGTNEWTHFESCSAAARELGPAFDSGSLLAVANGRVKQVPGGWTWEFTKQDEEIPGEVWRDVVITPV
eukprot:CAMPEP_0179964546 /NCGR_PEP_ID=MMETSP0983-20121128/31375_1 /TAXON_ID=483367 /ORGANISM="non described non described, Strain CCMP 2436" /LENGTH=238 /DNA_ID=CAMNT_0021877257 /DNA_START=158 /DNA_END=874 /DNA_ORIENTATION=-